MLGMEDGEIAQALQITKHRFTNLKKKHASFSSTLYNGRVVPSAKVAASLYKKATGFIIPEEKIIYSAKHDKVMRVQTRKYFAPDTVAQIFWLKNNYPEHWRDKKEVESVGKGVGNIQSVKFVLVQPGGDKKSDKIVDADFKILPGAGSEGREQVKSGIPAVVDAELEEDEG